MSEDNQYSEADPRTALAERCIELYAHLVSKMRDPRAVVPEIVFAEEDIIPCIGSRSIFLPSSLAHEDHSDQTMALSRIGTLFLQYHRNPRVKYMFDASDKTSVEDFQLKMLSDVAMTYGYFVGLLRDHSWPDTITYAHKIHKSAHNEEKQTVDTAAAWYGSSIFLKYGDAALDKVLAMTSTQDLNELKVPHLEGFTKQLMKLNEVR